MSLNPKKYVLVVLSLTIGLFLAPALLVYVIDPLFIYHKPYIFKDRGVGGTDRYLNAGLINNWLDDSENNIDTIIIGTSMSQQLPVQEIKNKHGVSALKLTAAGGTAKELSYIAKHALATGKVKHVVWEVYSSYMLADSTYLHEESPLPLYLYNNHVVDDWRYLFNADVVARSAKTLSGRKNDHQHVDELYLIDQSEQLARYGADDNLKKLAEKLDEDYTPLKTNMSGANYSYPSLHENLFPIIKAYPDVEFTLYFPPVSYYNYAGTGTENFWKRMFMIKEVLEQTKHLDNVSVHGFDLIPNQGNNLTNYIDQSHYSHAICRKLARSLAAGEHEITASEFDRYSTTLARRVNRFADDLLKYAHLGKSENP
jgi:hypothetical protein